MEKRILSAEEVAFVFGVSRQTIYNWTNGGDLTLDDVARLIDERQKEVDERQARVERARERFRVLEAEPLAAA